MWFASEDSGSSPDSGTSVTIWTQLSLSEFQEPAGQGHWINVVINISYYQFKNTGVPTSPHFQSIHLLSVLLVSGFTVPITSQMAVSCLISFPLCPNRRAGLWLGLEGAIGGEWLFLTNNQQSPGDREPHWAKFLEALVAVPGEPTRELVPRCSLQPLLLTVELTVCFLFPRVRPHLLPAWCWQGVKGDLWEPLQPPWAQKTSDTAQVVSSLFSGRFLLVTQNWRWYFQSELNYRGIKNHEEDG